MDNKTKLDPRMREYAELMINTGLNVQPGQEVVIVAPVEYYEFAHMCSKAAYEAGACNVTLHWIDQTSEKQRYLHADDETFNSYPDYLATFYNDISHHKAAFLRIISDDPELLCGVDSKRIARYNASAAAKKPDYRKAITNNEIPWTIAAVPNPKWASKVFPDLSAEAAMDSLWDSIFEAVYISGYGDSANRWRQHINEMLVCGERMNKYNFKSLHYTNSLGTDFTVDLPHNHLWANGSSTTADSKQSFIANMPTEEIFTAPSKESGNGVLYASMPLILNGVIINDLCFQVKNGKIIDVHASSGLDIIKDELALDEAASYLGELALVPYDSPISNQKLLYYETLFDENASCHIAFGCSYPECIQGGISMSDEELAAAGMNISDAHVDFMIGTADLKIVGTTYGGEEVLIFENGNFTSRFTE